MAVSKNILPEKLEFRMTNNPNKRNEEGDERKNENWMGKYIRKPWIFNSIKNPNCPKRNLGPKNTEGTIFCCWNS